MRKSTKTINIIAGEETPLKSIVRDVGTFSVFAGLIGLGVLLQSAAMQWAGFIVAWLVVLAWVGRVQKLNLTIDQARAFLDELEEGNK